jgi:Zn-dependent M28 family amino/carboxypeptidase
LKHLLKRTIRVICFGAEEITLRGSGYHAAKHINPSNDEHYRFVMNLDGAGLGHGSLEEVTVSALPEVAKWFTAQSKAMHYAFPVRDLFVPHSDHLAFALRGIPNGMLNSRETSVAMVGPASMVGRGFGHTEADTLDKVFLRGLQMSAILVARLAARIANDDDFPGRQRSVDEVREQLRAVNTLAFQEGAGRFPPT